MGYRRAVFLDRDGTMIEDVGLLKDPNDIRLFPDTIDALLLLQDKYRFFVVTNQSGVVRGEISIKEVDAVNRRLDEMLRSRGIIIEKWYVCPHERSDRCSCIKPNPTFLSQAAAEFGLFLSKSFIVGDHPHDVFTGDTVGTFGLYVLTGHGERHLSDLPPDRLVFHSLREAAEWIVAHPSPHTYLRECTERGAEAIRNGGLVVFPTETVYGLGADVFNAEAVARIFEVKHRPLHDPLIVHVSNVAQALLLVSELPPLAKKLMDRFWPGPLSLVLPKSPNVPDVVTAGSATVAIRMPSSPIASDLIRQAETPIAAPSANRFGCTSPTTAKHVIDGLTEGFDVLIDGGACRVGIESTVVAVEGDTVRILRPGGISVEDIEAVVGPVSPLREVGVHAGTSPGMLPQHYAPQTPLYLYNPIPSSLLMDKNAGKLLLCPPNENLAGPLEILSRTGNLNEAAVNLYAAMRRLDSLGLSRIVSHLFPDEGLGRAVNDRLAKASTTEM